MLAAHLTAFVECKKHLEVNLGGAHAIKPMLLGP